VNSFPFSGILGSQQIACDGVPNDALAFHVLLLVLFNFDHMPIGVKQLKGHGDPGRVFRYYVRKTKVILPVVQLTN
jgi:hypothetical protein